jgi:hypothetical protein
MLVVCIEMFWEVLEENLFAGLVDAEVVVK